MAGETGALLDFTAFARTGLTFKFRSYLLGVSRYGLHGCIQCSAIALRSVSADVWSVFLNNIG